MLKWYESYVYDIETYQNISYFLHFLNYGIFSYTNFAENMNVSLRRVIRSGHFFFALFSKLVVIKRVK